MDTPETALEDLQRGGIYRLRSRNLTFGVWNPEANGFVGVREKFYSRYLFTEYHWDTGEPFGTARGYEKVGQLDDGIPLGEREHDQTVCAECGELADFDSSREPELRWQHLSSSASECEDVIPQTAPLNRRLFDALDVFESGHARRLRAEGKLWRGSESTVFTLESDDGEREVDADEYFGTQDRLGICMGVHNFHADGVYGCISQRRQS